MIRVKLSDAIQVDVNTDDPAIASQEANAYFQQNFPREFSEWRNSQIGLTGTLGRSVLAGTDAAESRLFSVAEGLGQSLNLPALQEFARQGREQATARAAQVLPEQLRPPSFEEAKSTGDYLRFGLGAIGQAIPSAVAPVAGGIIGGAIGGVPGAIAGAALGAYPELAGGNIERQLEEEAKRRGVPVSQVTQIPSPGAAFATAVPQALAEGAVDAFTLRMARVLGQPVEEVARSVISRIVRGVGAGAATEVPAEVFQTALERAQAGLNVLDNEALREYKEVAAGAAVVGGVAGGAARAIGGRAPTQAQAQPETAPTEETTAPAPAPEAAVPVQPTVAEPAVAAPETQPPVEVEPTPAPAPAVQPEVAQAPVTETAATQEPEAPPQAAPEATSATAATAEPTVVANRHIGNVITEITPEGFTTAQGSTYQINEQGQTIRTKLSPGRGQGTTYPPHNVLYVEPQDSLDLLTDMQVGGKYRFVVDTPDGPKVLGPDEVIGDRPAIVAVFNPDDSFNRYINAKATPDVGLAPIELRYDTAPPEAAPAPEQPAPPPQITPEQEQELWRGYSLNAGPEAQSPIVQAARQQTTGRGAPRFNRQQFGEFVQQAQQAQQASPEVENQPIDEFLLQGPPSAPVEERRRILDTNLRNGPLDMAGRFFWSPIMTRGRDPEFRAISDILLEMDTVQKNNNFTYSKLQEPSYKLPAASQEKIMLAMQEARSRGQKPDPAQFTPEEYAAMENQWQSGQRVLDYFIEAYAGKYYDPTQATTPEQRARLEAFQNSRQGRLLTEMPPQELQQASQQGFEEIQYYNSLRDPLYFPQVSRGSHFLAAYVRKPNGKEDLARIYFYEPLNSWQRKRGYEDPEVALKNLLRREFPNSNTHRIMTRGVLSERDAQARDLRANGDIIVKYLNQLNNIDIGNEGKQLLSRMMRDVKKAQMNQIFRPYNDLLRAVIPGKGSEYLLDVLPKYYLTASHMQAQQTVQERFDRELEKLPPKEQAYWSETMNGGATPVEAFGTARAFMFFKYLGGAVDTAMIQFSQLPIITYPRFVRDAGIGDATSAMASALASTAGKFDVGRVMSGDISYIDSVIAKGTYSRDEVEALKRARQEGWLEPTVTIDARGRVSADTIRKYGVADKNAGKIARGINTVANVLSMPLSSAETFNRATSFLAALRLAKKNPEVITKSNQVDGTDLKTPYDYARRILIDTNYLTSKVDRPLWMRITPTAELLSQFLSPVWKTFELFVGHGMKILNGLKRSDPTLAKAGAVGLLGMTSMQIAFAGVWSLPFADRLRELFERIVKTFWGTPIDLKNELSDLLGGGLFASIANNGLFHAAGIASLQGRLAIDPLPKGDLFSWSTLALLGPTGSFIESWPQAIRYWENGDYWGFMANFPLMPRFAGNLIKGAQLELVGEQRTRAGNVMITPEITQRVDERNLVPASVRQAIGFPPPEFFDIRDVVQKREEINNYTRDATRRIHNELAQIVLKFYRARDANDLDAAARYQSEYYKRRNEFMLEQEKRPEANRVRINESVITQQAQQDYRGLGAPEVLVQRTRQGGRQAVIEELTRRGMLPNP